MITRRRCTEHLLSRYCCKILPSKKLSSCSSIGQDVFNFVFSKLDIVWLQAYVDDNDELVNAWTLYAEVEEHFRAKLLTAHCCKRDLDRLILDMTVILPERLHEHLSKLVQICPGLALVEGETCFELEKCIGDRILDMSRQNRLEVLCLFNGEKHVLLDTKSAEELLVSIDMQKCIGNA